MNDHPKELKRRARPGLVRLREAVDPDGTLQDAQEAMRSGDCQRAITLALLSIAASLREEGPA